MEVAVSALRAELKSWIAKARAGEEVVITERGVPVARLSGVATADLLTELAREGLLTPAQSERPAAPVAPAPVAAPGVDSGGSGTVSGGSGVDSGESGTPSPQPPGRASASPTSSGRATSRGPGPAGTTRTGAARSATPAPATPRPGKPAPATARRGEPTTTAAQTGEPAPAARPGEPTTTTERDASPTTGTAPNPARVGRAARRGVRPPAGGVAGLVRRIRR